MRSFTDIHSSNILKLLKLVQKELFYFYSPTLSNILIFFLQFSFFLSQCIQNFTTNSPPFFFYMFMEDACTCVCVRTCIRPMPKTSLLEPRSKSGMLPVAQCRCRCHCLFLLLPLAVLLLPLLLLLLLFLLLVGLTPLRPHHRLLRRRRRLRRFVCVNATRDGYLNY